MTTPRALPRTDIDDAARAAKAHGVLVEVEVAGRVYRFFPDGARTVQGAGVNPADLVTP